MGDGVADGDGWTACAFPGAFRRYQLLALAAVDELRAAGDRRAYVVMPPGSGKTVLGLEVARRLGRRTLVLAPNTAVQGQWLAAWDAFAPPGEPHPVPGSASRGLEHPVTVLTYQALSVWDRTADDEDEDDDPSEKVAAKRRAAVLGEPGADLLSLLHANGRALVERAAATGPWTVVLDECHHLLETWGALCRALVDALGDDTWVVGLTATPPAEMTARQQAVHDELFGDRDFEVPTAAVVQEGELAPFQELLYVTTPTVDEDEWIAGERARFADLQVELLAAAGSVPFAEWLRRRFVVRATEEDGARLPWRELERDSPALARAALRLVVPGLLQLPDGARLREEHRVDADAEDWAVLLDAYAREHLMRSDDADDARLLAGIRAVLPGLGYQLTVRGLRSSTSPVDRVCALSASKAAAAVHLLDVEGAVLGDDLRAVVLCDVEHRPPTAPSRLRDAPGAGVEPVPGSARTALHALAASSLGPHLRPVLVTGRTVAMRRDDVAAFRASAAVQAAGLSDRFVTEPLDGVRAVVRLDAGPGWTPRVWTALVTAWLVEGGTRCVVGTRGLLGEGWDCPALNVVVDLSSAATATSVSQVRGRSLRLDPDRPDKVADNWTVVCVADGHPRGDADHLRAARKHVRHLAPSPGGDIVSGIGHCDEALSPYAPPAPDERAGVNARALARAADRDAARRAWAVGTRYRGVELPTVQLRAEREVGLPAGVVAPGLLAAREVLGTDAADAPLPRRLKPSRAWPVPFAGAAVAAGAGLAHSVPSAVGAGAGAAAVLYGAGAARRYRRQSVALRDAPSDGRTASLRQLATAVADALHGCGAVSVGVEALRVEAGTGGWLTCTLDAPPEEAGLFASSLEELLAPLGESRWFVSRLVLPAPASTRDRRRLARAAALGRPVDAAVAWHSVPTELGRNKARVAVFEVAWWKHAGPGRLVRSTTAEGQALLDLLRGADPFALTSRVRTVWR
ncbi:MAG TPA: DEAD/DEAH box helicase family protein [Mycobacteriales bacterium]|nr:DEAD/DEAH box helicase family protein [Mycobacteriales bacterium]